jgi:flagella basal body P-ring formation protein FlgA
MSCKSFVSHLILFLSALIASSLLNGRASAEGGLEAKSGADESAVIQVKSVVELDGQKEQISLGDLIIVHGVIEKTLAELKEVRLADMPLPGESRSFTALGLEQVFRPLLHDIEAASGHKITLRIPTRVEVVRKSFRLDASAVESALKTTLKEMCAECRFEISDLILPTIPASVSSASTWAVKLHGEIPKGGFSLPVEVTIPNAGKRTFWVSGTLTVMKSVPVTTRSLGAGERVSSEDFVMQDKDVTFANDIAANHVDFSASVLARSISSGQVLWRSVLKREFAVKSGEIVKVTAGSNDWEVTIDGIAQASGYIGDTVNVKIPRTQKLVSGLLTAKGVVEVR